MNWVEEMLHKKSHEIGRQESSSRSAGCLGSAFWGASRNASVVCTVSPCSFRRTTVMDGIVRQQNHGCEVDH